MAETACYHWRGVRFCQTVRFSQVDSWGVFCSDIWVRHTEATVTQTTAENRSLEQAKSQLETIEQWHRLWEWTGGTYPEAKELDWDDRRYMVRELSWNDDPDPDSICEKIEQLVYEDPLSVEVRSGWASVGESLDPEEFCILLCTGGLAVRLRGMLSSGSVGTCWLEHRDWFKPWEPVMNSISPGASDALVWYAERFYWGE